MADLTIDQWLEVGLGHHEAGRLAEAEAAYRRILDLAPGHADALHLLGVIAGQTGRSEAAVELISRAIAAAPDNPEYFCELGNVLQQQGELPRAVEAYRQAVALDGDFVEAHYNLAHALGITGQLDAAIESYQRALALRPELHEALVNLGNIFKAQGRLADAIASYHAALGLKPDFADIHFNLGSALDADGQIDAAISSYGRAVELDPNLAGAHNALGTALRKKGRADQSIASYERALAINADSGKTWNNLGIAWKETGQLDRAVRCFRKALTLDPSLAFAHSNLGAVLTTKGLLEEAVVHLRRAVELMPSFVDAINNLANALKDLGRLDEAIETYQRGLAISPGAVHVHDNLIYTKYYHAGYDSRDIYDETRRWNQQHARPLEQFISAHANDPDPDRRLRIGYVSADFRDHASAFFLMPLFRHINREAFESICYTLTGVSDNVTSRMQGMVDRWRNLVGLTDDRAAALIHDDRIDILVDLKLHTGDNRLPIFARKPAPVQVTWLGYPGTTGLDTMDYRLTDPYLDPPGLDDACYSERSIRLPHTFWCYDPLADLPEVNPLPCLHNGYLTFGCLNNFAKLNEAMLVLWSKVLASVAGSRLLLLAPPGDSRDRVLQVFAGQGVAAERIEFSGRDSREVYLQRYHQIDIALDTFPCNGHTTSLDAFWMGVPVITLVGKTAMGRAGASQLSNLGLTDLIARSADQYVEIVVKLAADRARLSALRASLRPRMEQSPLMDGDRFAGDVESVYRTIWRSWCQSRKSGQ